MLKKILPGYNTINKVRILIINVCLILIWLLLVWCSRQELSQSELWANKHLCFELKADILANIESQAARQGLWAYTHIEKLEEIFYSPIRTSCMYTTKVTEIFEGGECMFYKLYDFYAREYAIESIIAIHPETLECDDNKIRELYDKTIQSLQ